MGAMALDAIFAPGLDGELAARLLELTSDVAAAVDRDGVAVQANPALVRAAGRDPAGLPREPLVEPGERPGGRAPRRAAAGPRRRAPRPRRRDGRRARAARRLAADGVALGARHARRRPRR